jgi:mannose-6-phosphate isomerase-like protein (cupin superfamily)
MPERVTTEIPIIKIDPNQPPDQKIKSVSGNFYPNTDQTMFYEEALVTVEDFGAGEEISWFFPEPEVQYILKGRAEMTYSLGATSHTETKTVTVQEGDCYIIPAGARCRWKVTPESPLRKFCVLMPFPQRAFGMRKAEAVEKLR